MEFSDDIGKLQRLMAASSAGIARRQAIMDNLVIKADDKIIDIAQFCGKMNTNLDHCLYERKCNLR